MVTKIFASSWLTAALMGAALSRPTAPHPWIAAWAAAPVDAGAETSPAGRPWDNQTVRQIVRLGSAGTAVRVLLSNELGARAIHVADIHFALCDADGNVRPGTDRPLTFGGRREFEIPAGSPLYSDPATLPTEPFVEMAISIFYPDPTTVPGHLMNLVVSAPGNHAQDRTFDSGETKRGPGLVSRIDVRSPAPAQVMVAFGDSITQGPAGRPGHHMGWPEQLADALAMTQDPKHWTVINAGINGNRLLHAGGSDGPSGLARFDRDALDVPGATRILLLEGINDIGFGAQLEHKDEKVSAAEIIYADRQLIARAHARGLRIVAGSLLPFEGAGYYDAEGEATRVAVNEFIRSGAFDGVIDFDAALQDPQHPTRLLPGYDRGDHLHPNDAGFTRMAQAVAAGRAQWTADR
jgi:lysophospholipase L1-like esterase